MSSVTSGFGSAHEAADAHPPGLIDRRNVLLGGAAALLLGAAGAPASALAASRSGTKVGTGSGSTVKPAAVAVPSPSALANGGEFDVAGPSTMFLREKKARDATVMQTFAFDDVNGVVYIAQVTQPGRQLTGEAAPVTGAQRLANGDITVTRLSYAGQVLSWMYLRRFGHPVAIGVEAVGTSSYLWIGTAAVTNPSGVGYGTKVGRVKFVPNTVVDYPSAAVEVHQPVQGTTGVSVSFDSVNRTLLMRAYLGTAPRYYLYGLDAFRAKSYVPLFDRAETGITDVFQGHAHLFDQVYRIEGRSGGVVTAPTHISRFDLPSGAMTQRVVTEAAKTLTFREPQGLAVQRKPLRLHMGFADGQIGARNLSLYYKDRYVL